MRHNIEPPATSKNNAAMTSIRIVYLLGQLLGCSALLLLSTQSTAGDFERGMAALEQGYAQAAIRLWKPLAETGSPEAQFGLGVIYNDAMGVPQDYAEANYWFLRAAEQHYAPAQYNLGNAYKYGTGMQRDDGMAVIWWRKAAEADFGPAQYNLGSALLEGSGVPRDREEGLNWYRRAAANGHPMATEYLEAQGAAETVTTKPATPPVTTVTPAAPAQRQPEPDTPPRPVPVAESTPAQHVAPVNTIESALSTEDCFAWLARGMERGYTIQLMAAREAASVNDFVHSHQLEPQPVICAYPSKGGTWHAVVYGQYASGAAARAGLAELPEALRNGGAYLRRLQELRAAMVRMPNP